MIEYITSLYGVVIQNQNKKIVCITPYNEFVEFLYIYGTGEGFIFI
jgi:hypothetical protein